MKILMKLIAAGLISGITLGGFLKLVEGISGKFVYVLLLNVDYIPIVRDWQMNEIIELTLHLIVSILLVIVLYYLFKVMNIHTKIYPYVVVNMLVGGVLFLTTAFSQRTPEITDIAAFIYWIVGHLIYGAVVGSLLFLMRLDLDEDQEKN
ncbi:hypothetical protein CIL05_02110 [Virgibacillus profundi]|uniref:DUF1440 domain-containing protein n=2 Tax=Virgibacillus profundi TaxID=2024555 RepID=A0A2A2IHJ8_9BACI|nr:hypothetical protein CIL05_02110 [Virgibacillus profundi]PXY55657.1 hypothetical protein CIT14_02120 [Virgibacillus profundi]